MINITLAQLKVFSALFSNLAAAWLITIVFATANPLTLTLNLIAAIMSAYLAVRAEEIMEEL